MGIKKRINKKVWVALVFVVVIEILFDPYSDIKEFGEYVQADFGLPHAREKWESQSVSHYSFDVYAVIQNGCFMGANIEVDGDIVVHAGRMIDPDPWDIPQGVLQNPGFPSKMWFICDYKNFTAPKLFDYLEGRLQVSRLAVTSISFDDTYGFISEYGFGSPGGWGLLSRRIFDCCGGFSIRNFQVLDE